VKALLRHPTVFFGALLLALVFGEGSAWPH
jgi:hypothetical protein